MKILFTLAATLLLCLPTAASANWESQAFTAGSQEITLDSVEVDAARYYTLPDAIQTLAVALTIWDKPLWIGGTHIQNYEPEDSFTLSLEAGSREALLNGQAVTLPTAPTDTLTQTRQAGEMLNYPVMVQFD